MLKRLLYPFCDLKRKVGKNESLNRRQQIDPKEPCDRIKVKKEISNTKLGTSLFISFFLQKRRHVKTVKNERAIFDAIVL